MRRACLSRDRRSTLAGFLVLGFAALVWPTLGADPPRVNHDATFRPTVIVRQGKSLGSGVIFASVEGETLILTASHVVEASGAIEVELNRFNLGLERTRSATGFPRRLTTKLVARDVDADLAILRIRGELAFPYVARFAPESEAPDEGTPVMTIGFDRGERLIGFGTRIRAVERIDMGQGGGHRAFLVTEDPPELGRSGGGLFRADGALIGVCVARAELEKGRKLGLFAPLANVRTLIQAHEEIRSILARSNRRPRSAAR